MNDLVKTLLFLGLAACTEQELDRDSALAASTEQLAPLLADRQLRGELEQMLAGERDGIPYARARTARLSDGRTLGEVLPADLTGAIPNLQLTAPLGLSGDLVVTHLPAHDGDDLVYHAPDGSQSRAPAADEPSAAVLVLGTAERSAVHDAAPTDVSLYLAEKTRYLRMITIFDDHEPWYRGDPEIYIACRPTATGSGHTATLKLENVNEEDHAYWPSSEPKIVSVADGNDELCEVLESDNDYTPPLDDSLGTVTFRYADASYLEYDFGDGVMRVRW